MRLALWVGVGGAAGSMLRHWVSLLFGRPVFPWATLTVNVLGSFLLGFLATWAIERWPTTVVVAVSVGLLGGFTTFSSLAWESVSMIRAGRAAVAVGYVAVSVIAGLTAAVAGLGAGRALH